MVKARTAQAGRLNGDWFEVLIKFIPLDLPKGIRLTRQDMIGEINERTVNATFVEPTRPIVGQNRK